MNDWTKDDITTCTGCKVIFASSQDYCPSCGYPQEVSATEPQPLENRGLATLPNFTEVSAPKSGNGKGKSKQRSKPQVIDGIIFDSKVEGSRYRHLKQLQLEGVISFLRPCIGNETKEKFCLVSRVTLPENALRKEKKQRAISYTPDFQYWVGDVHVIEDVKGKYGNSKKNRAKGIVGKPIIGAAARLRHKILQADRRLSVFIIVINPTSAAGKDWSAIDEQSTD